MASASSTSIGTNGSGIAAAMQAPRSSEAFDVDVDLATLPEGRAARSVVDAARLEVEVEALRRAVRSLSERNRSLEDFTCHAAHDLRNPLRIIHGFADLLLDEFRAELGEHAVGYVERMLGATGRLESLVEALLELGRVSNQELAHERVDLAPMAEEIVADLAVAEPGRRVTLRVPGPLVVHGDPALLHVAMSNLLANAWKFTRPREEAEIRISTSRRGGDRVVSIEDNGVGFEYDAGRDPFRPFERLHSPKEFEGSGVGLATVQRVVERHGGRVWAEGEPGVGATFHFALPETDG